MWWIHTPSAHSNSVAMVLLFGMPTAATATVSPRAASASPSAPARPGRGSCAPVRRCPMRSRTSSRVDDADGERGTPTTSSRSGSGGRPGRRGSPAARRARRGAPSPAARRRGGRRRHGSPATRAPTTADQLGVRARQRRVVEPELGGARGAVVVDHDVGGREQLVERARDRRASSMSRTTLRLLRIQVRKPGNARVGLPPAVPPSRRRRPPRRGAAWRPDRRSRRTGRRCGCRRESRPSSIPLAVVVATKF